MMRQVCRGPVAVGTLHTPPPMLVIGSVAPLLRPDSGHRPLARGGRLAITGRQGREPRTAAGRPPSDVRANDAQVAPQVRRNRYAEAIQAAAYFAAAVVTNVIKSADVEKTTVRRNGLTMAEVHDDGQVFAPSQTLQTGLTGLCDRLDLLSGHLELDSRPGRGTVPCATLPVLTAVTSHA